MELVGFGYDTEHNNSMVVLEVTEETTTADHDFNWQAIGLGDEDANLLWGFYDGEERIFYRRPESLSVDFFSLIENHGEFTVGFKCDGEVSRERVHLTEDQQDKIHELRIALSSTV